MTGYEESDFEDLDLFKGDNIDDLMPFTSVMGEIFDNINMEDEYERVYQNGPEVQQFIKKEPEEFSEVDAFSEDREALRFEEQMSQEAMAAAWALDCVPQPDETFDCYPGGFSWNPALLPSFQGHQTAYQGSHCFQDQPQPENLLHVAGKARQQPRDLKAEYKKKKITPRLGRSMQVGLLSGLAFINSPRDWCSLREIYAFVCTNFCGYQLDREDWKKSIRHSLCTSELYERVEGDGNWRMKDRKGFEAKLDVFTKRNTDVEHYGLKEPWRWEEIISGKRGLSDPLSEEEQKEAINRRRAAPGLGAKRRRCNPRRPADFAAIKEEPDLCPAYSYANPFHFDAQQYSHHFPAQQAPYSQQMVQTVGGFTSPPPFQDQVGQEQQAFPQQQTDFYCQQPQFFYQLDHIVPDSYISPKNISSLQMFPTEGGY